MLLEGDLTLPCAGARRCLGCGLRGRPTGAGGWSCGGVSGSSQSASCGPVARRTPRAALAYLTGLSGRWRVTVGKDGALGFVPVQSAAGLPGSSCEVSGRESESAGKGPPRGAARGQRPPPPAPARLLLHLQTSRLPNGRREDSRRGCAGSPQGCSLRQVLSKHWHRLCVGAGPVDRHR